MATIQSQLRLNDGVSGIVRKMTAAVDMCLSSFEQMQAASGQAMNLEGITAARVGLSQANAIIEEMAADLQTVENQQNGVNRAVSSGTGAFDGMLGKIKQMAGAYLSLQGLQKVMGLADSAVSTQARLEFIVDDGGSVMALHNQIMGVANRSRASFQTTFNVVSKLGVLAGRAFADNNELLAFTELMNKNFVIGNASVQEQTNSMYQLTQAMAAGKLQGDEFRSIMENAPLLATAIESYMQAAGVEGSLKDWSSQGLLTAEVIKNALFSTADEIEARFDSMPYTFSQIGTLAANALYTAFMPVIQYIGSAAQYIHDNWESIAPAVYAVAGAIAFYAGVQALAAAKTWLTTLAMGTQGLAVGAYNLVIAIAAFLTGNMVVAQTALNAAMAACPLLLVAMIIGVIIFAIYKWVQSVGGLDIAWKIVVHGLLVSCDWLKIKFFESVYFVLNLWDKMALGIQTAGVAIANFMGDMKASVLMILQNMVNGAINIINDFIGVLNAIPGVNIGLIEQVTFGTTAQLENEAEKQARMKGLEDYRNSIADNIAQRETALQSMKDTAASQAADRWQEIQSLQAAAKTGTDDMALMPTAQDPSDLLADIANNTGSTAASVKDMGENVVYLRDIAERETINRYTTAEIKVDMNVSNRIDSSMDIDGVLSQFTDGVREALVTSAEGVHK